MVPIYKTHTYILTGVLDKGGKYILDLMQGVWKQGFTNLLP
jgi:hypothetical protein